MRIRFEGNRLRSADQLIVRRHPGRADQKPPAPAVFVTASAILALVLMLSPWHGIPLLLMLPGPRCRRGLACRRATIVRRMRKADRRAFLRVRWRLRLSTLLGLCTLARGLPSAGRRWRLDGFLLRGLWRCFTGS